MNGHAATKLTNMLAKIICLSLQSVDGSLVQKQEGSGQFFVDAFAINELKTMKTVKTAGRLCEVRGIVIFDISVQVPFAPVPEFGIGTGYQWAFNGAFDTFP